MMSPVAGYRQEQSWHRWFKQVESTPTQHFVREPCDLFWDLFVGVTLTENKFAFARHRALPKYCMGLLATRLNHLCQLWTRERRTLVGYAKP